MAVSLKGLNENLKNDLPETLRISISVHVGNSVVGDMGYAGARSVTATGDPVSTASRVETMSRGFTSQLIVSEKVAAHAGVDLSAQRSESVALLGGAEPFRVYVLNAAAGIKGLAEG
jgi:adenylate cyclase